MKKPTKKPESLEQNWSTAYKRDKYWHDYFSVILPKEVIFGRNELGGKLCAHYVPINKVLTAFVSNVDVWNQINQPYIGSQTHLSDICDGSLLQEIFEENTIYLQMYSDEFEVCNPLGAKRLVHKLLAVYFSVLNVPAKFRSKMDNIHLAMLAKHTLVQQYGIQTVLKPLLEILKDIEETGIFCNGTHYKVVVLMLSADNLGSHSIGGFSQCFSSGRICRFCMASKELIGQYFQESDCILRTHDIHETHLTSIEADPNQMSIYGVNERCIFDELKHFRVTKSLPPDVMHDVLEGTVRLVVKCVLRCLINEGVVNLDTINDRIKKFHYHFSDKGSKPMEIKRTMIFGESQLKGSASQNWCLLRLLPVLIGEFIPEGNEAWQVFLLLRKISDVIFAPMVPKSFVPYLIVCIHDCLSIFVSTFPMVNILPKMHYMIHYPSLLLQYGSLVKVWSMRFESKHRYFKAVPSNITCFINISMTLSKRYQLLQALQFSSPSFLQTPAISSGLFHVCKERLSDQILIALEAFYEGTIPNEDIAFANSIIIENVEYKVHGNYCIGFENDMPFFINTVKIVWIGKTVVLFGEVYTSTHFNNHFHCYFLQRRCFKVVKLEEIIDVHVLPMYTINGERVVNMKYSLFNE